MAEEDDNSIPLEEKLIEDVEEKVLTEAEKEEKLIKECREKFLMYVKPDGKITKEEANIIITDESHGFCNVIKRYLLKNEHVLFASYKKIFYEDPSMYVNTDGEVSALDAFIQASEQLHSDLQELEKLLDKGLQDFKGGN